MDKSSQNSLYRQPVPKPRNFPQQANLEKVDSSPLSPEISRNDAMRQEYDGASCQPRIESHVYVNVPRVGISKEDSSDEEEGCQSSDGLESSLDLSTHGEEYVEQEHDDVRALPFKSPGTIDFRRRFVRSFITDRLKRDSITSFVADEMQPPAFSPPPLPEGIEPPRPPPLPPRQVTASQSSQSFDSQEGADSFEGAEAAEASNERLPFDQPASSTPASEQQHRLCTLYSVDPFDSQYLENSFRIGASTEPFESDTRRKTIFRAAIKKSTENLVPPPSNADSMGTADSSHIYVNVPLRQAFGARNSFEDSYDSSGARQSSTGSSEQHDVIGSEPSDTEDSLSVDLLINDVSLEDSLDSKFKALETEVPTVETIPVIPFTPSKVHEKCGYLFKMKVSGTQTKAMVASWKKRWVVFKDNQLTYYGDTKDRVSRGIIPVASMKDILQQIKRGDSRPYQMKLVTTGHKYLFASETVDDLNLWASVLMHAIISNKDVVTEAGGVMGNADYESFLKIEGMSARKYVVIKRDKLAYYKRYEDFKTACPIHIIDLKLASVKELGRNKLQLTLPYGKYTFLIESNEECLALLDAIQKSIAEGLGDNSVLHRIYRNPANCFCADCGTHEPEWSSVNLCITLCKICAGIHRGLGVHISKVRSMRIDTSVWTDAMIEVLVCLGNDKVNHFWEAKVNDPDKPCAGTDRAQKELYIRQKYAEHAYCMDHLLKGSPDALNTSLKDAVCGGDACLEQISQLVFLGADVNQIVSSSGMNLFEFAELRTPLVFTFLSQNGGKRGAGGEESKPNNCPPERSLENSPKTASSSSRSFSGSGGDINRSDPRPSLKSPFLLKSRKKEPVPVICQLLDNRLLIHDEKESQLKESFYIRVIESIKSEACEDKGRPLWKIDIFLKTNKVYSICTEHEYTRDEWFHALITSFSQYWHHSAETATVALRLGFLSVKKGSAGTWTQCWVKLSLVEPKLMLHFEGGADDNEELDVRKIVSLTLKSSVEACTQAYGDGKDVIILDYPNKTFYLKSESEIALRSWHADLLALLESYLNLRDIARQPLTNDNVPVIVEKCLNFISAFGISQTGIYRISGEMSKVSKLFELFEKDPRSVILRTEDYSAHDVASLLKKYFRSLDDCVLKADYHVHWCGIAGEKMALDQRLAIFKELLGELPELNYCTLKKLLCHLNSIAANSTENMMPLENLGAIFGQTLLFTATSAQDFSVVQQEICVVTDLLRYYSYLFEVDLEEAEKEKKMLKAIEKLKQATNSMPNPAGDLLIGIHLESTNGESSNVKIDPNKTASDIVQEFLRMKRIEDGTDTQPFGLFEILLNGEMERVVLDREKVLPIVLSWNEYELHPSAFCLCVKRNYVHRWIHETGASTSRELFGEIKFCDKKSWKKAYIELTRESLLVYKDLKTLRDPKAVTRPEPNHSWPIESIIVYKGIEKRRSPPTEFGITINIHDSNTRNNNKDYFGYGLCFPTQKDVEKWIGGLLAQSGPVRQSMRRNSQSSLDAVVHHGKPSGLGLSRGFSIKNFMKNNFGKK